MRSQLDTKALAFSPIGERNPPQDSIAVYGLGPDVVRGLKIKIIESRRDDPRIKHAIELLSEFDISVFPQN